MTGSRDSDIEKPDMENPMLVMVDNYDSFTWNLVQYLGELGAEVVVHRNDEVTPEEIEQAGPLGVVVSPGPCTPREAGISVEVVRRFAGKLPVLGVCLGHQCIASAFGGKVVRADRLMHGKTSPVEHDGRGVFSGLPQGFIATRYHSLIVERESLPAELEVSAWTAEGEIMGIRHKQLQVEGVQFHPESILTSEGKALLGNFLDMVTGGESGP
jgi:anthranilate synthase/aminodeoxychorismate synthase-like glutamine amidotransferase